MAAVKPRGNRSTELAMAAILRRKHLRGWRRHYPVAGTPDFCWARLRIALFVDGCFWHGCPSCRKHAKTNVDFWRKKVLRNRRRDVRVARKLRGEGWIVLRVWECAVKEERTIARIERAYIGRTIASQSLPKRGAQ